MKNDEVTKLSVSAFGLAIGVTNAIGMLLLALMAQYSPFGMTVVHNIASIYHGYTATLVGSLVGACWGFGDGLFFGVVVAWFYNFFVDHCCCGKKRS